MASKNRKYVMRRLVSKSVDGESRVMEVPLEGDLLEMVKTQLVAFLACGLEPDQFCFSVDEGGCKRVMTVVVKWMDA